METCSRPIVSSTIKEFLNDSYLFSIDNIKLLNVEDYPKEPDNFALIFEKTIFHPQGGGQPSDEGEIQLVLIDEENSDADYLKKIVIEGVGYDRDREIILHKISKKKFPFISNYVNRQFNMKINEEKRKLFARIHSAGHLLDIAVGKLDLKIVPGKGYHFPDSPYVEYNGSLDKGSINYLTEQIEKISNEVIETIPQENVSISKFYDYDEGKKVFQNIPSYLPEGKNFRWVKLTNEDIGCPCGGTHVQHVKDIKGMKINKITIKGKIVRISYNVI
jgi:Ser-tRNA(Ala) deacylase AlaX